MTGTLTQSGGDLTGAGTLTVSGLLTWTGGSMTGSALTVAEGGLDLRSPGTKYLFDTHRLENAGAGMLREGGTFYVGGAGVFDNRAGATFDLTDDTGVYLYNGIPALTNAGTLRRTTSSGT